MSIFQELYDSVTASISPVLGYLITTLLLLLSIIILIYGSGVMLSSTGMPPGPCGLPVVGYLPWLDHKAPYKTLDSLVNQYGKIYSVKLGSVNTVVLADAKLIKDCFSLRAATARAPLYLTHGIMKGYGLICSEGFLWKEHRKFVLGYMRDIGMRTAASRPSMERKVNTVAKALTKELLETCGKGVDISGPLMHHVGNTLNELIFGITYSNDDPKWRWLRFLLEEGVKCVGIAGPLNFLPWLRFLPKYRSVVRFIKDNQIKTHEEYQKIISEYEESCKIDNIENDNNYLNGDDNDDKDVKDVNNDDQNDDADGDEELTIQKHLIAAYTRERRKRQSNIGSFTYDQIHHVAADLFGAGTETTLTTLKWHLLDLALHPDVQAKVTKEVLATAMYNDGISLDDLMFLKYTQAAIMETQRLRSIVPLGVPHGVDEDITVGGYKIPAGTMLLPLLWRVHRDPDTWNDPETYNPDRFLDDIGILKKFPEFIPFQAGRRMCIGDDFAKMLLILFTTNILMHFQIKVDLEEENGESCCPTSAAKKIKKDLTDNPICGFTLVPQPFKLCFIKHSSLLVCQHANE